MIESEGVAIDGNDLWVQSYVVSTSNDSARGWMDYENGVAQEVSANKNAIFFRHYPLHSAHPCARRFYYGTEIMDLTPVKVPLTQNRI